MNTPQFSFRPLPEKFKVLLGDSAYRQIALVEGEFLFEHGDVADFAYLLIAGSLSIFLPNEDGSESEIDRLFAGAIVGEMGILARGVRSASARATASTQLIVFTPEQFTAVQKDRPHLLTTLPTVMGERWQRVQLIRVLEQLLGKLDVELLHQLQMRLEWIHLNQGERLFKQGDEEDGMYILVNGRLQVVAEDGENERFVGEVIAGETIGEYALVTQERRSATSYATRESALVKMSPALFQELGAAFPQLLAGIMKIIVERQKRMMGLSANARRSSVLTLTLIPADTQCDITSFAEQLAGALSKYGRTRILRSAEIDNEFRQVGASQWPLNHPSAPALLNWIATLETRYEHLIFVPDNHWSQWTQRCLNQSDRVLIVADATNDPQPQQLEKTLADRLPRMRQELALWHPATTEHPLGTARWLIARSINNHYHVRDRDPAHFARLARRLTGRAIGLVLSGGGARGYAHAGVYRLLRELGIGIDAIGGTSFGALGGGFFARETTYPELLGLFKAFDGNRVLFDRTLPFVALNSSHKLTNYLQKLYGDWQIEDLWVPFFCIAANLTAAEELVIDQGSLWQAVRKSVSVPGVFAPVVEEGELIVDGGIINNFPVDVMTERLGSPHILGSTVSEIERSPSHFDVKDGVSGWQIVGRQFNPFTKPVRVPSIGSTLMRTLEVNNVQRTRLNEQLTEVLIRPNAARFSIFDFEEFEAIADIGYEASQGILQGWWEDHRANGG